MSMGKKALMLGLCGAVLSAAVLLIEKKNREKKFEEELWDAEEGDDAEIEFSMSAGDIDFEVEELPELEEPPLRTDSILARVLLPAIPSALRP